MITQPNNLALLKSFQKNGYVCIENLASEEIIKKLQRLTQKIMATPEQYQINDWSRTDETLKINQAKLIQVSATRYFPQLLHTDLFLQIKDIASRLMEQPMDFWFDQFLIKPPNSKRATPWHQDEAYWGKALENKAITCWIPLQDVSIENGCMCYLPGYHKKDILTHYHPRNIKSDLLACKVKSKQPIACPVKSGSIILHHCRTPHMALPNKSNKWRQALTLHLKNPSVNGEGDLYPWRIYYNQKTDEIITANKKPREDTYF